MCECVFGCGRVSVCFNSAGYWLENEPASPSPLSLAFTNLSVNVNIVAVAAAVAATAVLLTFDLAIYPFVCRFLFHFSVLVLYVFRLFCGVCPLGVDEIFTLLVTFLIRNVAQGNRDQNDYRNAHYNADQYDFVVDALVRVTCTD